MPIAGKRLVRAAQILFGLTCVFYGWSHFAFADYTASKAAIEGYTRGAARDLAARGITVNTLGVGPVATDMNPDVGDFSDWLRSVTALGRYGTPGEIANVAVFLASPAASYITGAAIPVDGGAGA